jgi:hypothetical protein
MSALFEARATKERLLYLRECGKYVFARRSLEIGEMAFCKPVKLFSEWSKTQMLFG